MTSLPTTPPFGVYYVPPASMGALLTYSDVDVFEAEGGHAIIDAGNFVLKSGLDTPGTTARTVFTTSVPDVFTFEASLSFDELPSDFSNVSERHVYLGVTSQQGSTFGLFFSKVGIAYTGNVNYSGTGDLQINSAVQLLPNSVNLAPEGVPVTLRVAVDLPARTTYIYVTRNDEIDTTGQLLKYVLPAFDNFSSVISQVDSTFFSVRGEQFSRYSLRLISAGLGAGLLIPNSPPVAQAGSDQSSRLCTITRLDGRSSFDPEGASLSYSWRLLDGPDASSFVFLGEDGVTYGAVPTDLFYSASLEDAVVAVGDVLLVSGIPGNVIGTGTDGNGFFVQLDGAYVDGGLVNAKFRLLRQSAISDKTLAQPSFLPDVVGLYRFDLIVFDGDLYSSPSQVVVSVVESPVPRGITPDVSFLWDYISDFWRLVENTEVIQTFWEALTQIAASEMLTLWQHDYGKSLRDVQRTFQRKWLHYDLFLREPFPNLTKVGDFIGDAEIYNISPVIPWLPTFQIEVSSPLFETKTVTIGGQTNVTAEQLADQIRQRLKSINKSFQLDPYASVDGSEWRFSVRAPFPFRLTFYILSSVIWIDNTYPQGIDGVPVGVSTYRVGRRLDLCGAKQGDFLVVDGVAYAIDRIISSPDDIWPYARIVTSDPLPAQVGSSWKIVRGTTSSFVDFYKAMCAEGDHAVYEVVDNQTEQAALVTTNVLSASGRGSSTLLVDTDPLALFLGQPDRYSIYFYSVYRRNYLPIDPLVVQVPRLQQKIKNAPEEEILRENVDYFIEDFRGAPCLRFLPEVWGNEEASERLWAEITYLDNSPTIEENFGLPAEFTLDDLAKLPSSADYLSIVRGLWYAYFNGPTVYNLRVGAQILLGLPFAEMDGEIIEIRDDFTVSSGRILIRDKNAQEIVRSYKFPASLGLEINPATNLPYAVGDLVKQFAPLIKGVEVTDYVKDPDWFSRYLSQGAFLEVEKFFKFLVRVDSDAFSLSTLLLVQSFIRRIKPTYTDPFFVVLKSVDTTIDVADDAVVHGTLHLNEWVRNFEYDGSNYGHIGGMFDDARPAGGGWKGDFDGDGYDGSPTPGPTPAPTTHWGFDRNFLDPENAIVGTATQTHAAPWMPAFDGLISWDLPAIKDVFGIASSTLLFMPFVGTGTHAAYVGDPATSAVSGTANFAFLVFRSVYPLDSPKTVTVESLKNGVVVDTTNVTLPPGYDYFTFFPVSFPISAGDVLEVRVSSLTAFSLPEGGRFFVVFADGVTWQFDTVLSAGTYSSARLL